MEFSASRRYLELSNPQGPLAVQEWQTFLHRRQELLDQIMGRLGAHQDAVYSQVMDPQHDPRPAIDLQITERAIEDNAAFRQSVGTSEYNDLLGQAQFYGIADARNIPPDQLATLIERRRSGVLNERVNAGDFDAGLMARGVDALQTSLGTIFTGSTQALVDAAQSIPFIGDVLAKTQTVREADRWLSMIQEGYRSGLTDQEEVGWRIAHTGSGMLGFALPAGANYAMLNKVAGAIPVVARLSPIARAAVVGGADAWTFFGGGDAPLSERALAISLGAGLGAGGEALGTYIPRLFGRAQQSFYSRYGVYDAEAISRDPNIVDGVWEFEPETKLLGPGARQLEGPGAVRLEGPPGPQQATPRALDTSFSPTAAVDETAGVQLSGGEGPLGMGEQNQMAAMRAQISELIEQRNLARRMSEQHPLTGLPNRRAFDLARATADADPNTGFVVMDARGFKKVNDTLGHSKGDQALVNFSTVMTQVAEEIEAPVRIFHFGGDEFAAILPKEKLSEFASKVERGSKQKFNTARFGTSAVRDETTGKLYEASGMRDAHNDAARLMLEDRLGLTPEEAGRAVSWGDNEAAEQILDSSTKGLVIDGVYIPEGTQEFESFMTDALSRPRLSTQLDAFTGSTFDEADQGLMRFKESTRQKSDRITPREARIEANQLTKQASVLESPALAVTSQKPTFGDLDVVQSIQASFPGQVAVVRGVGLTEEVPGAFYVDREGQVDVLVGATEQQGLEYARHGMFTGQRVTTANGVEAVVDGFNVAKMQVTLRQLNNRNLKFKSKMANVMPSKSGGELFDSSNYYSEFRNESIARLTQESIEAGLPNFDWLSIEMDSQLPRYMNEYFEARPYIGPEQRAVIENFFNYSRVQDHKALAPQEFALAERIAREASELMDDSLPVSVEDLAAAKGFEYQVSENQSVPGEGVLRDQMSQLQVPVESEAAASEFLRNFDRELPDLTPESPVPLELFEVIPGGSTPTDGPEPVWSGTAHTEWMESTVESAEREMDRIARSQIPGALPPGGGSGRIPPRGPFLPSQSGAGAPGPQFRRADPLRLAQFLKSMDSITLKWLEPMRNWTMEIENKAQLQGFNFELWRPYQEVSNGMARAHNEMGPWMEEAADIVTRFRHKYVRDGTVVKIEQLGNWNDKLRAMQAAGYSQQEMDAQAMIRPFFDRGYGEARKTAPIGYLFDYIPALRNLQSRKGIQDPFGKWERDHLPYEWSWFARYPRAHNMQARHLNIGDLMAVYVRGLFFEKNVAPAWNEMKQMWADPAIPSELATPINGWLELILSGVGAQDDLMISGSRYALNKLGIPVTDSDIRSLAGGVFGTMYRAGLGLSPSALFRDSIQPAFAGTELGFEWVGQAYKNLLDPELRGAMMERGIAKGWVQKGMTPVAISDAFSSPATVGDQPFFGPKMTTVRESIAQVFDRIYDATPRKFRAGIQGTGLDPMLLYTRLGEFNRLIAGSAGEMKAGAAIESYRGGQLSFEEMVSEAGATIYDRPINEHFRNLVNQGNFEDAIDLMAQEAANSQFRYGTAEQSVGLQQAGTIGRAAAMYGNFATQYWTRMRSNLRNLKANGDKKAAAGFLARQVAVWGAITGAAAYTGWKGLERYKWNKALAFAGGPLAQGTLRTVQAAGGVVATAFGQRPQMEQESAMAQFGARGMESFFPYAGGMRNLTGIAGSINGVGGAEATVRGLMTGEYGSGRMYKSFFDSQTLIDSYQHGSTPPPYPDVNQVLQARGAYAAPGQVVYDTTRTQSPTPDNPQIAELRRLRGSLNTALQYEGDKGYFSDQFLDKTRAKLQQADSILGEYDRSQQGGGARF